MHVRFLLALLLFVHSTACSRAVPFGSLTELREAMNVAEKSGKADPFWDQVKAHRTMPIIFDQSAVFFWRGHANTVEWRGDFSSWESSPQTQGKRLGKTDVFYYEGSFPRDARLDYKVVIDGEKWGLDPHNPHAQVGGYGPNSEVRMPDWRVPQNTIRRDSIARGNFSKDIALSSVKLGYSVNYRVYTPATSMKDLPVLYVTDGSDYWTDEMGSLVITLDNLIADEAIGPVLVVFIDPWDRKENVNRREKEFIPAEDRSCSFCEFIVDELIPTIDAAYPTRKTREGRAIVGTSYGGLHAALMSMRYGSLFGMVGIQSPAFRPAKWVLDEIGESSVLPEKAFINMGTFEWDLALRDAQKLRDTLKTRNVDVKYIEPHEGHSWGHWRALLDDMLIFFYGKRT